MRSRSINEIVDEIVPDFEIKVAIITKEKGKWCVKSPDNPDWSGGCYDTKEEAEKRLDEVEYFKQEGSV